MTDRRRNGLILLLVLGLLAASAVAILQKPTRQGLDLRGGVELVYEGKPTPQQPVINADAISRALQILRERVDKLGVAEPEIQQSGKAQISVGLPAVKNAERAQKQVGTTAQLLFYDWEPNVIGPDGKTGHEDDPNVTEAPIARYDAVVRAAKRPAVRGQGSRLTGQFYLVDDKRKEVVRGPEDTAAALTSESPAPAGSRTVEVKPGTTIVQAEAPEDPQTGQPLPVRPGAERYFVLDDRPALSGTDLKNPEQRFDQGPGASGQPIVTFDFTDAGRRKWAATTQAIAERGSLRGAGATTPEQIRNASGKFAIVLDDQLVSRPIINYQENPDGIDGRQGSQISGGFTIQSAQDLANNLKIGALPIRLELISQSQVSATLGKQALNQGLLAGAVGLGIVVLFLLTFYRVLGLIASVALVVYGIYFFALIKLIPITLTLPGIAGLILTIGVAADANIVIFERIKEEVRAGRSIPAAIAAGYRKGFATILDANVVTFLTAFILFVLATAGVKGFALTLGIGVLVSLLTAVLATSAILGVMGRTRLLQSRSALGAGATRARFRFDYMGASRWFFSASGLILLIGALAIGGKGLNFGIDFESGTRMQASLERPATEAQVRDVLASVPPGFGDAQVQRVQNEELGRNAVQIETATLKPDEVTKVTRALDGRFGVRGEPNTTSVGPTFGQTVARSALIAIIASLLVISAYIALRFEWKFAVPVLIALSHDILITSGVYALAGREVTTATVAALLTVLGFSLYDTIIVFDRVRENVPRMPRAAFSQIVNRSMSEVLARSLATSFCAALPVLALLLFGGETLKDFAFALLIGTISGTYSSIFIAAPVVTHWKERERVYRRRRARIEQENDGTVPAYAGAGAAGGSVDVEPTRSPGRRGARRVTSPDQPEQVSDAEFQEMVRDLHGPRRGRAAVTEDDDAPAPRSTSTATRRAQRVGARAAGPTGSDGDRNGEGGAGAPNGGGRPDGDRAEKPPRDGAATRSGAGKRPRNRRHGRPR